MTNERAVEDRERADFLETLSTHRSFLRRTVRDLTDAEARERTTVSELCLGGVIKHVTRAEKRWADFIVRGPVAIGSGDEAAMAAHAAGFRMLEEETLASLLEMGETHEVLREDYPHIPEEAYPVAVLWAHANPRRGRPPTPWDTAASRPKRERDISRSA